MEMNSNKDSQFSLMKQRRFAPLFLTQFLGAFNDNVFKNALILIIAFKSAQMADMGSDILTNVAAGLFILPFFLFSALAGQVADKCEKSKLIQRVKLFEILIMACAAVAFFHSSIAGLLFLLFLMGTQSAFFGPVKYSIIPQHLKPDEIVGANALVEMGTFVAILFGTIAGGVLSQVHQKEILGGVIVVAALSGWVASQKIPIAKAPSPDLKISWNLFSQTWKTFQTARQDRSVFLSILAISWFWFLGAAYVTQFPSYTLNILKGSENVVILLLACFSVGIGIGSLFCERLSGKKIELGLVPFGAIGLSIFGIDLCFAFATPYTEGLLTIGQFLKTPGSIRVIADLILIGVFGGFYTVPLYAFIQLKTHPSKRARVIAASNILNALLMVGSALAGVVFMGILKFDATQFYLAISIVNIAVAVYIFSVVPEFAMRFMAWIISCVMYRVKNHGLTNIPEKGPAVLACNHVSFVDWLLIASASRRPVRFVVFEPIYRKPLLNFIFKTSRSIPIQSKKQNPIVYENAFAKMSEALEQGDILCIFPEGKITTNGELGPFKAGIEKIVKTNPVPVIPMAIRGMWGSFFSNKDKKAFTSFPTRFWSKVELVVGSPILSNDFNLGKLNEKIVRLRTTKDRQPYCNDEEPRRKE